MDEKNPEYSLNTLISHKGVQGYVIFNQEGVVIKSHGISKENAVNYASLVSEFNRKSLRFLQQDFVHELIPPPKNTIQMIRLRTKKNELLIAPDTNSNYTLVVIHDPSQQGQKNEDEELEIKL